MDFDNSIALDTRERPQNMRSTKIVLLMLSHVYREFPDVFSNTNHISNGFII